MTVLSQYCAGQLQIFWQGVEYPDGVIPITSDNLIGEFDLGDLNPGGSVVCDTAQVNTQCCRRTDGGNAGEWFFSDESIVPRRAPGALIYRTGFTQQVRLNFASSLTLADQLGTYTCEVPNEGGTQTFEKTITIGKWFLVLIV